MISAKKLLILFSILVSTSALATDSSIYDLNGKWKSDSGKSVSLSDFKGKKAVLAMMYTSCKTACPLILKKLRSIESQLLKSKIDANFLVVTFDTDTDSTEKLGHFKSHMELNSKTWTLLVGSPNDTRQLSMVLGIKYNRNSKSGEIMHDNKIILLNEQGAIVRTLEGLDADSNVLF